jgi:hypothetical protein
MITLPTPTAAVDPSYAQPDRPGTSATDTPQQPRVGIDRVTIVALTGRAGAGKDTVAHHLVRRYDFAPAAFADPLRAMLCALLVDVGIDYEHATHRANKEDPLPVLGVSWRRLIQTLGTEWGRAIEPDLWVRLLLHRVGLPEYPVHDRIVVTDVRYPNEAAALTTLGARIVGIRRGVARAVAPHSSEAHIDGLAATWIDNDGTLDQLVTRVDGWCMTHGITPREIGGA